MLVEDMIVGLFYWPVLAGTFVLAGIALFFARCPSTTRIDGHARRGAMLRGYFGVLFATFVYAWLWTTIRGFEKVGLGHIVDSELPTWIAEWSLYTFVLFAVMVLLVVTVFGLPLFLALRRFGFASLVGVLIVALMFVALYSGYLYLTYRAWCESNLRECVWSNFGLPILVALGFAGAAPLAVLRSR